MKKWMSITALTLNLFSQAFAGEISKEKLFDLLLENRESYERVVPGMQTRRTGVWEVIGSDDDRKECRKTLEETVVQVLGSQYLVHQKSTYLHDCGPHKKGEIDQYLVWENLLTVEESIKCFDETYTSPLIIIKDGIVHVKRKVMWNDKEVNAFFIFDIKSSQFDKIRSSKYGPFNFIQIESKMVDPATINIENVEVIQYEN